MIHCVFSRCYDARLVWIHDWVLVLSIIASESLDLNALKVSFFFYFFSRGGALCLSLCVYVCVLVILNATYRFAMFWYNRKQQNPWKSLLVQESLNLCDVPLGMLSTDSQLCHFLLSAGEEKGGNTAFVQMNLPYPHPATFKGTIVCFYSIAKGEKEGIKKKQGPFVILVWKLPQLCNFHHK